MATDLENPEPAVQDVPLYPPIDPSKPPRLGTPFFIRLPIAMGGAFVLGMAMGASYGSTKAAYRFRAENAHRFPTTSTGWYQYHKSKNYKSMLGGLKEGLKMGSKLGVGTMAFCLFEETVDHARNGHADFLSTITAGLSFSGIYSVLARHDIYTAARTVKLSLKMSLAYGLLQDAISTLKGNPPWYIGFLFNAKDERAANEGDKIA
ncbi:hypothetical protein VTO42DRAFT_4533 [Malbranchea cinnamomea]